MNRTAIIVDTNAHSTMFICVDNDNASTILQYLNRDNVIEEFRIIRMLLRQNQRNREKYCKCDVADKAEDMFEMRFTNNGKNDRIYCKEVTISKVRHIIMCELFEGKKSQEIPKAIRGRIKTMGSYEFTIKR